MSARCRYDLNGSVRVNDRTCPVAVRDDDRAGTSRRRQSAVLICAANVDRGALRGWNDLSLTGPPRGGSWWRRVWRGRTQRGQSGLDAARRGGTSAATERSRLVVVGETGRFAWNDRGRECAVHTWDLGDVAESRFGWLRTGPDVSWLRLERADVRALAEGAANVLAVGHRDVGVRLGEAERVVQELSKAGATGKREKQKERSQTPSQGIAPGWVAWWGTVPAMARIAQATVTVGAGRRSGRPRAAGRL